MCVDFFLIQYNRMVSLSAVFHSQVLEENLKDHLEGDPVHQKINPYKVLLHTQLKQKLHNSDFEILSYHGKKWIGTNTKISCLSRRTCFG